MALFHRLSVPSYFGGLPAGYDYVNNAISGTPAPASGQQGAGPNAGSYFITFGEDATANDANRPAQALATNTDYLDDILRTDLVQIIRSSDSTVSGSPLTSVTITGSNNIWLGSGGYALQDLFHVVDSTEREIEVSGTRVVVSAIASGGTLGGGFATGNVTLTLNVGIPVGVTWHIYYCQRTNLASIPIDALTLPFLRNQDSVDGSVVDFVAQISAPGVLGSPVTALEAYTYSTPYSRLAATGTMTFSCDPTDSGATVRHFYFVTRGQTVNRDIFDIWDDPTSSAVGAGLTGRIRGDVGVAYSSLGTLPLQDANIVSGLGAGMNAFWPLTSSTTVSGDQYPRLFEKVVTDAAFGNATPPSILRYVNGRWCCTVGDGTNSFGDFSGAASLEAALAYAAAAGVTNLHIQMKLGTFTVSSSHTFAGEVVLEGHSSGQTVIQTHVTASSPVFTTTFGLILKHLSIVYATGAGCAVVVTGATAFLEDVGLYGIPLQLVNGVSTYGQTLLCRDCYFQPSVANSPTSTYSVLITVNDGVTHAGYQFYGCTWLCADETGPVQITAFGATLATTVEGVLFRDCYYTLGGTATTSSHLTTNTGVLYVNPAGTNLLLNITDVTWEDCYPSGNNTSSTNGVLARIHPIGTGDNSTSHKAVVGAVVIRGGIWTANACSGAGSIISQLLIAAQTITVADVIFNANSQPYGGGPSSEDQYIIDGVSHSVQDWHQFIFAPGGQSVLSPLNGTTVLAMRNVQFQNFVAGSSSGDIWFYLGGRVDIDGVFLSGYQSSTGTLPNARVRVTPNATSGSFKGLSLHGASAGTGTFTNYSNRGLAAFVLLEPSPVSVTQALLLSGLILENFTYSGSNYDDGIVMVNPATGTFSWRYWIDQAKVSGVWNGFAMYGQDVGSQGGNNTPLANFRITDSEFSENFNYGILLNPDELTSVQLEGNSMAINGLYGLYFIPHTWTNGVVTFTDNYMLENNANNAQAFFASTQAGASPHMTIRDNVALGNLGALASIKVQFQSSGALPSTGVPGNLSNFFIFGVHTGISSLGVPTPLSYTSTSAMMENMALLLTP
jgi:hypothetical protein